MNSIYNSYRGVELSKFSVVILSSTFLVIKKANSILKLTVVVGFVR